MKQALLTPNEAAAYLAISVRTLRRFTKKGIVRCVRYPGRIVRYAFTDLNHFVDQQSIGKKAGEIVSTVSKKGTQQWKKNNLV